MSRRVLTEFEILPEHKDLVEKTLDTLNATYVESEEGVYRVTKADGRNLGFAVEVDIRNGELSYTTDDAPSEFADSFRQTFSRKKLYREASVEGHVIEKEWVSSGDEEHDLLAEVEEGDIVVEASVSL